MQLGESAVVVRYGGEAVELSYDVLNEALGMYSFMSYGLDAETAKKLYTYMNSGDAQQDELVWQSILNTEMNRLLSLVMERGLFRMTEEGGFETRHGAGRGFAVRGIPDPRGGGRAAVGGAFAAENVGLHGNRRGRRARRRCLRR